MEETKKKTESLVKRKRFRNLYLSNVRQEPWLIRGIFQKTRPTRLWHYNLGLSRSWARKVKLRGLKAGPAGTAEKIIPRMKHPKPLRKEEYTIEID